ncbi:MAG TPA: hypothetical protein VHO68_09670 [Bacteroidales bacterium]|nr:hypothetical protein [Bacteroidales bacterium]
MITRDILTDSMTTVTRNALLELSRFHNTSCISIYIPTHRSGMEALSGQDSRNLKNQLKEIRNKLQDAGLNASQTEKLVNPILELVEDNDFWRYQSEGLAVFAAENIFEKFTLPVSFREFNYLSSEFYLTPLLPIFNDDGLFYLLTLKKDEVKFYEASKYAINEISSDGLFPGRLEDVVGYDYEQKQQQNRTQRGANSPGSFHGNESEAKDKNELEVFFRAIDKGIMSRLHDFQEPPLVICCLDHYFPIFREICTHRNLYPQHISSNPSDHDISSLHRAAREVLVPYFRKNFEDRKDRFLIGFERGKASRDIREIVGAAVSGRIDTLFVEKNSDAFGIYDPTTGETTVKESQTLSNVSLMNLAAKHTFEQGGTVYNIDRIHMPDGSVDINALFRY